MRGLDRVVDGALPDVHGADPDDVAGDPPGDVQVVDHLVHDDAARELGVGEPGGPGRERTGADEPQHGQFAELPGVDRGLQADVLREVADHVRRVELPAGLVREPDQVVGVRVGAGQRLLADDVLAGGERGAHDLGVGVRGDDDVHHVDTGEECVERVDHLAAVCRDEFLGADLREDDDVPEAEQVRQVRVGDHPRADEADPESLSGHGVLLVRGWCGVRGGAVGSVGGVRGGGRRRRGWARSRGGAGEQGCSGQAGARTRERLLDAGSGTPAEPGVHRGAQRGEEAFPGLAEAAADDDHGRVEHGGQDRDPGGERVDRVGPHRGGERVGVDGGDDLVGRPVDGAAGRAVAPSDVPGGGVHLDAPALPARAGLTARSDADVPDLAGTSGCADHQATVDHQARGDTGADRDEDHLGDVPTRRGARRDLGGRGSAGVVRHGDGDAVPVAQECGEGQVVPVEVDRDDHRPGLGVDDPGRAEADGGERVPGGRGCCCEPVDHGRDGGEGRAAGRGRGGVGVGRSDVDRPEGGHDRAVEDDVADADHPLDGGAADVDGDDRAGLLPAAVHSSTAGAHAVRSAAARASSSTRAGASTSSIASTVAPRMPASRGEELARTSRASATIGRHDR